MLLSSRRRSIDKSLFKLSVCGTELTNVDTFRYLGVIFDKYLSWEYHVNSVVKRARLKLFAIYRLLPLPPNIISLLYKALILPIFDYCDIVWSPSTIKLVNSIESLHGLAVKIINHPSSTVNLPSIRSRREFHLAIQVFRCTQGLSPTYLHSSFNFSSNNSRSGKNYCHMLRQIMGRTVFILKERNYGIH